MFKEIMYKTAGAAIVLAMVTACGNNTSESTQANELLSEAQKCIEANDPAKAFALIDSINKTFPKELEIRRNAMHLQTIADSMTIAKEIVSADSTIKADSIVYQNLKPLFTFVKTKDMVEGYYVVSSLGKNALYEKTGIEPRIDENGNAYVVSCHFGPAISHTSLTARTAGGSARTGAIPFDGASNYRYGSGSATCEMVTFHADKCADFMKFIADNADSSIQIDFIGKSKATMRLSRELAKAFQATYQYAQAMQSGKNAYAKRVYLDKKRELNRKQMARTAAEANK